MASQIVQDLISKGLLLARRKAAVFAEEVQFGLDLVVVIVKRLIDGRGMLILYHGGDFINPSLSKLQAHARLAGFVQSQGELDAFLGAFDRIEEVAGKRLSEC
jgi:hypothetical protein